MACSAISAMTRSSTFTDVVRLRLTVCALALLAILLAESTAARITGRSFQVQPCSASSLLGLASAFSASLALPNPPKRKAYKFSGRL